MKNLSAKLLVKFVKKSLNTFLAAAFNKEYQHEVIFCENHCQQTFSLFTPPFYRVHFDYIKLRMALHKGFEILVGSPLTVGVLSKFGRLRFSLFVPDFSRKVNIPNIKYALVNVIVDGSAGKLNFIGMVCEYVTYRLPVKYQWREQLVQTSRLFFRSVNVFSRFGQEITALFVRFVG